MPCHQTPLQTCMPALTCLGISLFVKVSSKGLLDSQQDMKAIVRSKEQWWTLVSSHALRLCYICNVELKFSLSLGMHCCPRKQHMLECQLSRPSMPFLIVHKKMTAAREHPLMQAQVGIVHGVLIVQPLKAVNIHQVHDEVISRAFDSYMLLWLVQLQKRSKDQVDQESASKMRRASRALR